MLTKVSVIDVLKRVKDPETDLSLYDLGVVKYIDYEDEGQKLIIALDFDSRMPSGLCCRPLAWMVQKKMVDELERELLEIEEVREIEFKYF